MRYHTSMYQSPSKQEQELIRKLSSRDTGVRYDVIDSFIQTDHESSEKLLSLVRTHVHKRNVHVSRKRATYYNVLAIVGMPYICWLYLSPSMPSFAFLGLIAGTIVGTVGNYLLNSPSIRLRYSLVQSMLLVDDIKLLGPLIGCIGFDQAKVLSWSRLFPNACGRPPELSSQINQSVIRLIARLQPEDHVDVTSFELSVLLEALRSNRADLVIALLRLLEQIGDNRELPSVRALENGKYSVATNPAIREAAAHCRAAIESRLKDKALPGTLLRASQPSAQEDTLVRPVVAVVEEQAVLLRAAQDED